ncbi:MAG: cysteine hydrolase [Sphingopyxis sp.]|nr:cysteine hydrolase [Sphingopyxis sp.]
MSTALLVVDVQNILCQGKWAAFDVLTIVANINVIIEQTRNTGGTVVFIQHEADHDAMRFGTDGWHLHQGLNVSPHDLRVRKRTSDAFFKTNLYALLDEKRIKHVMICGMQTEYCVDSTMRGALANGFSVTVIADGHTTLDNGVLTASQIIAHHNVTMANLGNFGPAIKVMPTAALRVDS